MSAVTRRLRIATSPVVLAVALGLLGTNALVEDEEEAVAESASDASPDHAAAPSPSDSSP